MTLQGILLRRPEFVTLEFILSWNSTIPSQIMFWVKETFWVEIVDCIFSFDDSFTVGCVGRSGEEKKQKQKTVNHIDNKYNT